MPDTRGHRGPDPRDAEAFSPAEWPRLREAVGDYSWLLGRGYAEPSALKLVGDRHRLVERQRMAVRRSSCSDEALARRRAREVDPGAIRGRAVHIDGFNVLTTVEAALGGAVVLLGRDRALRDLAGVHGTYRRVEETLPALRLLGESLASLGAGPCTWLLDRPVSNSGRLSVEIGRLAADRGWDWSVELVFNPDPILAASQDVVVTADAGILDLCGDWLNLARLVVEEHVPDARAVDLGSVPSE